MPLTIEQKKQLNGFLPLLKSLERDLIVALNTELLRPNEQDPRVALFLKFVEDFNEQLERIEKDFEGFIASIKSDDQIYTKITFDKFKFICARIKSLHRFCLELIGFPEKLFKESEVEIKGKLKSMPKFLKEYANGVEEDIASSLENVRRNLVQPATVEVFKNRLLGLRYQQRQEFLHKGLKHLVMRMILFGAEIKPNEDLTKNYGILNCSLPEKIDEEYAEKILKSLRVVEFIGRGEDSRLARITQDGMVVALTAQRLLDECTAHVAVLTSGGHEKASTWAESSIARAKESLKQTQIWSMSAVGGCASFPEVFRDGKPVTFVEALRDALRIAIAELTKELELKTVGAVAADAEKKPEEVKVVGAAVFEAVPAPAVSDAVLQKKLASEPRRESPELSPVAEELAKVAPVGGENTEKSPAGEDERRRKVSRMSVAGNPALAAMAVAMAEMFRSGGVEGNADMTSSVVGDSTTAVMPVAIQSDVTTDVPPTEEGTSAAVLIAPNSAFLAPPKSLADEPPKTPQGEMRVKIDRILTGTLLDKFINGTFTQWLEQGSVPTESALESTRLALMGRVYHLSETQANAIITAAQEIFQPKGTPRP